MGEGQHVLPLIRWLVLAGLLGAQVASAEQMTFTLDTERSEVRILLGAFLHTVSGVAPVGAASFRWDAEDGSASGQAVVQAALLDTGIDGRNQKMRETVLLTSLHPEIRFEATGFELRQPGDDEMRFVLRGNLVLLGASHEVELETYARRRPDDSWKARADLYVPYVEWGLEDPSMPLFAVDKHVTVEIKAIGRLTRP